ncbi:MAG: response regulator [Nitrosopumilus sp.]|uniref:TackOD1 domain-containing metal-binding protein n=1 Tax=Nitrosopumilus sp. TaxID=2024843 RepID=UPI0029317FC9|nr:response regulator [Nitrosopumilus sp.]
MENVLPIQRQQEDIDIVEQLKKESIDIAQLNALEDNIFSIDSILIVEDSISISSTLQKYFSNLGFKEIHLASTGNDGLAYYENLIKEEQKIVSIILDDSLGDIQPKKMVSKLFEIYPRAIIILLSALDKSDKKIIELLNMGIYDYVQKPLNLDRLQEVVEKIKKEKNITNTPKQQSDTKEKIVSLLRCGLLSNNHISDMLKVEKNIIEKNIRELETSNAIRNVGTFNEPICNRCSSSNLVSTFSCPACSNKIFSKEPLIEHHECGNVEPAKNYVDGKCPKCNKELKILGVDYQRLENYYVCNNCNDKFSTLNHKLECNSCNSRFEVNQANWTESRLYKI